MVLGYEVMWQHSKRQGGVGDRGVHTGGGRCKQQQQQHNSMVCVSLGVVALPGAALAVWVDKCRHACINACSQGVRRSMSAQVQ